uniref:Uncharacterized protein n=1 Tax=Bracon brevicornis TaxID=1563983 RepID=A0A6V7LAC9_9HYME
MYVPVSSYPLKNGKLIYAESKDFSTLLIIQQNDGVTKVLRLSPDSEQKLILSLPQTIPSYGANHIATWTSINRLYLGVASATSVRIYIWLGENFDQIQSLDFPANKLIPVHTGGSTILIATGNTTRIISYQLKTNEFSVIQTLKRSTDAVGFQRENGYFGDNFLALADDNSTIIYKEHKHRYVPFQRMEGASQIQALSSDKKIILFFIKEEYGLKVFQYDGWRFTDRRIILPDVQRVYPTFFCDGTFVLATLNSDGWHFQRMIWQPVRSWKSVKDGIGQWCAESLNLLDTPPIVIPKLRHPLVFTRARINHLSAWNVDGRSVQKFSNATQNYKNLLKTLEQESSTLEKVMSNNDKVSCTNFSARNVKVMKKVIANNTRTIIDKEIMSKLRILGDPNKNYTFKNIKSHSLDSLNCPIPAVNYKEVNVTGRINGLFFESFVEDILKTNADEQLITGMFEFEKLKVEDADMHLDIAWNSTRQELKFDNLTVDELEVPSGYFLPLDGPPVTLTGDLSVSKMKISGLVHLTGQVTGPTGKRLQSMIHVIDPLVSNQDYQFNDIKIVNFFKTNDLHGTNGESYKTIRNNSLPLSASNIPIHMKFNGENVEWRNVMLEEPLGNWVTVKNFALNITGRKTANNVTLLRSVYDKLPILKVPGRACSVAILTDDVYMTNITMNNAFVNSLKANKVFGALQMEEMFSDSAKSWEEVPWSLKNITGQVEAKNATISEASNVNLPSLYDSMKRWSASGKLKGPIKLKNLTIKNLTAEKSFNLPLPKKIGRFQALKNVDLEQINGIKIREFIDNVLEIDDMISLTNITFLGGITVDKISTSISNIPLFSSLDGNFGTKTITGIFQTHDLVIPDDIPYPRTDVPIELAIDGNVEFINEPIVKHMNGFNVEKLSKDIWMKNKLANLTGNIIFMDNVAFAGDIEIGGLLKTPKYGPWYQMSEKIFSKSLDQQINQEASFNHLQIANITGSNTSRIISSPTTLLHDLEYQTLKKNRTNQTITATWNFERIDVDNGIQIDGRINNLDLNNDIIRLDSKKNFITGTIIVDTLVAENIIGLNFSEFAKNTLMSTKQQELITIKGKKIFNYLKVNSLNLTSKINGKKIESCLLKYTKQLITGKKIIEGNLLAPGIKTEGLINDVEFTKLLVYQLKKKSPRQVIETPISLENGFNIQGNLIIDKYRENYWNHLKSPNNSFSPLLKLSKKLFHFAGGVDRALQARAFYFDKLELIEENSTPLIEMAVNETVRFNSLGSCHIYELILYCNGREIFDFSNKFNASQILELKAVSLAGRPKIVCLTSAPRGGVSIYYVNEEKREMIKEKELQIPDVLGGSVAAYREAIWIVLMLQDYTVILRYDPWKEFYEHILDGNTQYFALTFSRSDELLLFRNDGVWRLGGLGGPKLIFSTHLEGKIDVFSEEYIQLSQGNSTNLLQIRYSGN